MDTKINYSLSYYFDELKKREQAKSQKSMEKGVSKDVSIIKGVELLKALKEAQNNTMPLTALSRKVNLKVGPCQELCDELKAEGLIEIETDDETGNDRISLTDKGRALL